MTEAPRFPDDRSALLRYGTALLMVVAATGVRWLLGRLPGPLSPFTPYYPAILVAAWYGGRGPGLFAVAASALAVAFFFVQPAGRLLPVTSVEAVAVALFLLVSLLIVAMAEAFHRARSRFHAQAVEKERLAQQLAQRVDELDTTLELLPVGIAITSDPACRTARMNRAGARMLGDERLREVSPEDGTALPFRILRRGEEVPTGELPLQRATRLGRTVTDEELEIERADGSRITTLVQAAPLRDAAGQVRGAIAAYVDISALARAEQALRRKEELLRLAQGAAEVSSFEWQLDADVVVQSDRLPSLLNGMQTGVPAPMEAWLRLVHPDDRAAALAAARDALAGDSTLELELRFLHPERGTRWISIRGRGLPETRPRLIGVTLDVTDRKLAEERRERLLAQETAARQAAEAGARARDSFLATISHELRTPLSPILAWSHMLRSGVLDEARRIQAVETIERCAKAQAKLIEDLLDASRIAAGKLRLDVQPLDLGPVVQSAIDVVRPAADAKSIEMRSLVDPRAASVSGDPERLRQVVWNLLSNAVKFTPKGGRVQVSLQRASSQVELEVRDSGPGIAPEFLPHLFDRFTQEDTTTTRAHGGLGLGLSIARQIVEAHGGTIHAANLPDEPGAVFSVKLPLLTARTADDSARRDASERETLTPGLSASLASCRVLVVDDEPESNEVVRTLLSSAGAEVRVATSAAHALDILSRWRADVLVSDIGMPKEDGYALISRLRARSDEVGRIPALALTAYASVEDRVRLFSAGFQAHVTKPLEPAELVATVAELYRSPQPQL